MIPLYRKIALSSASSFSAVEESPPLFSTPWHYHPEYELILIRNGRGKRFMGDNISDFKEIELILIGPNLPHFWKSTYDDKENLKRNASAFVIHFSENFLGKDFFIAPECRVIHELLSRSRNGIQFNVKKNDPALKTIPEIVETEGFGRVLKLLQILGDLAKYSNYTILSSKGFVQQFNGKQNDRMGKVYGYIMENFKNDISLTEVSEIVHMAVPAFCRYFKISTGKTFNHLLRDIRIGHACKLLIEDRFSISQIAFDSGFNNISNFNRQFKEVMHLKPLEYKKQYHKKVI